MRRAAIITAALAAVVLLTGCDEYKEATPRLVQDKARSYSAGYFTHSCAARDRKGRCTAPMNIWTSGHWEYVLLVNPGGTIEVPPEVWESCAKGQTLASGKCS